MQQLIQKKYEPLTSTYIQPSLEIGKEDDEHEQEANSVADKVMRMREPENEKKKMHTGIPAIQRMPTAEQKGMTVPPKVEQGIHSSKGSGQNLQVETQQEMGSKIGADFSDVNVHTDSNAVQMSKEIGAKAFTHGNDIYFNQGQYNPSSNEGKHLLAHELTHTVQQTSGISTKIQRKIFFNDVVQSYSADFDKGLSAFESQIYNAMINSASDFKFLDQAGLKQHIATEVKFRTAIIEAAKNDETNATFGTEIKGPETHWQRADAYSEPKDEKKDDRYAIKMVDNVEILPSDAIKSIFSPGSGSVFDCSAMMTANIYKAMLDTFGSDKFNEIFKGDKRNNLVISPEFVYFKDEKSNKFKDHPLQDTGMMEKVSISSLNELIPGDWVYFINALAYKMIIGANGPWMGEHATYTGKVGEDMMFKGFGIRTSLSYAGMIEEINKENFISVRERNLGLWKAIEKWAPDAPAERSKMLITLSENAFLTKKFTTIEDAGDSYKLTIDVELAKILNAKHGVPIANPVLISKTEYDPAKKLYIESDTENQSITGHLPGLSKMDVLRPRVDKMK